MLAAAELAALRLQDLPSLNHMEMETDRRDRVFRLLDKNGDGRISIEELMEVMEELGAPGDDAREMMQLLDANSDGSLSSDEFDVFQNQVPTCLPLSMASLAKTEQIKGVLGLMFLCTQVELMRSLEDRDDQYKAMLNKKLHLDDIARLIPATAVEPQQ